MEYSSSYLRGFIPGELHSRTIAPGIRPKQERCATSCVECHQIPLAATCKRITEAYRLGADPGVASVIIMLLGGDFDGKIARDVTVGHSPKDG